MIEAASADGIAVLGVETFEVRPSGVKPLDYSSYEIPFSGDWTSFVQMNRAEARSFVRSHPLGEEHGYLLTCASNTEFRDAQKSL